HTDRTKIAIALHNRTLQLRSPLKSMIDLMELALHNSTNQCLINDFGDDGWLLPEKQTLPLKRFEQTASIIFQGTCTVRSFRRLRHRIPQQPWPCARRAHTVLATRLRHA